MTTIGRGRGWGKSAPDTSGGLRRPGQPVKVNKPSNVDENDEWIRKINELDINDGAKGTESPLASVLKGTPSEEELKHLDNTIEKALEDRDFAVKFVSAYRNPQSYTLPLLSHLQPHYEDREKMIKEDLPRFLNLVYILSKIYNRVRYGLAGALKALEVPIIVCYETLLTLAGEEEIELAATEISLNGRLLHSRAVKGLPELIINAREVLATRNLSSRSRVMLMLIIDLYNQDFNPLTGELLKFYADHLSQETLMEMQSNSKNLWIVIDSQKQQIENESDDTKNENNPTGILMQVPSNQKSPPKKHSPKNYQHHNNSGKPNNSQGPRAIRGSGAAKNKDHRGDKKYSDRKDKGGGSDNQWSNWSNNDGNNKSWNDHDDRFSKDY